MNKKVPEPFAELVTADDIHQDIQSLSEAIEQRDSEKKAYLLLKREDIKTMLDQLIQSGICQNEEEAIERALKTLVTAVIH